MIIDLHQDVLLHIDRPDLYKQKNQTSFEQLKKNNVRVVIATAFPYVEDGNYQHAKTNKMIESDFNKYLDSIKNDKGLKLITDSKDLESVFKSSSTGIVMHIEGLNSFSGTGEDWELLNKWHGLGWRSLGILWNISNQLGGGTEDPDKGLTGLGKEVIKWCLDKGMLVDFAHMNERTFFDAAKIVNKPIIVSHGNVRSIVNQKRNYSDKQLDVIAESNGVIGLFFSSRYVNNKRDASLDDLIKHMDYLKEFIGIDHIALGSDFGGIITSSVNRLKSVGDFKNLFKILKKRGYSDEGIEKIAYKNSLRVIKQYLS